MDIKTKYDIGDIVFYMYKDKIIQGCIKRTFVKIENIYDKNDVSVEISYDVFNVSDRKTIIRRNDNNLFFTKEELLKKL